MNDYVIMPASDYQNACDVIRAASGKTDPIKSGDLSTEIAGIVDALAPPIAEELTVELDFSDGDMTFEPSEGAMFETVSIPKPANLIPENIAEGAEIAGIMGTHAGSSDAKLEGDLLNYLVYQLDQENKEIIVYGILWSQLYTDTGSYDITIPGFFGSYRVVLVSEGVS